MSKTKIISFCSATRELRAFIKAEGFDGPISNETELWDEVLTDVEAVTQADDPRGALDIEDSIQSENYQITNAILRDGAPPHVFILPRGGGSVGLLRALVLRDLERWFSSAHHNPAPATAYVWGPYSTKIIKVFPSSEG
jgi:hypothetical protein